MPKLTARQALARAICTELHEDTWADAAPLTREYCLRSARIQIRLLDGLGFHIVTRSTPRPKRSKVRAR